MSIANSIEALRMLLAEIREERDPAMVRVMAATGLNLVERLEGKVKDRAAEEAGQRTLFARPTISGTIHTAAQRIKGGFSLSDTLDWADHELGRAGLEPPDLEWARKYAATTLANVRV